MIVCKPTWICRQKRHYLVWWHEWKDVPFDEGRQANLTGRVHSVISPRGPYIAVVGSWDGWIDLGEFATLEEAQVACDTCCVQKLGATLEEASENWKAWAEKKHAAWKTWAKKKKRAARKAERDRRNAENAAKTTPER